MALKRQAIQSLFSGTLTLIVFGSIYTFGALTPYISSYLYYKNDETSSTALSILFTLTIITINIGVTVSNMFLSNISSRIVCLVAVIGMASGVFISSFMEKFVGFVAFYGVWYGFFIGIGYYPPVKNAYLHLPHKKGLVSGICYSGFGLGSGIFNYVILAFVNPHNVQMDKQTKKFPQEIAQNLPFALKMLALTYVVMGSIGALLIQPPKTENTKKNYTLLSEESSTSINQSNQKKQQTKVEQKKTKQTLFQFFIRKKAYMIIFQIACIAPFGMFIAFNYKRLAFQRNPYFLQNDRLITTIGSIGIFCNGLFRSVWGFIFDHVIYKKIILTINTCLLAFSVLILFAVENPVSYAFIIPFIYMSYGGLFAILPTQTVRVLGHEAGSKIFWLTFAGFSIASVIQFTVQYFVLTYVENGWVVCMGIFFGLEVLGLIISLFTTYEYEDQEKNLIGPKNQQKQIEKQEQLQNDKIDALQ